MAQPWFPLANSSSKYRRRRIMLTRRSGRLLTLALLVFGVTVLAFIFAALSSLLFTEDTASLLYQACFSGLYRTPRPRHSVNAFDPQPDALQYLLNLDDIGAAKTLPGGAPVDHKVEEKPAHVYSDNGLLTVNPDGPHPIYELIERAEAKWTDKHKRASRTFDEAVIEYKRRYKRAPPQGFDLWWDYVQTHNIQLPDEYDQIYHDLEPYWGVDPEQLVEAQRIAEGHSGTYTIGKLHYDDVVTVLNMSLSDDLQHTILGGNARPQIELLEEVYNAIPPFRAVFYVHDNPVQLIDNSWKSAALQAAAKGTYLKEGDFPEERRWGWAAACPLDSPLSRHPLKHGERPTPQINKTFIHDHRRAMDVCAHPQLLLLHGQFLPWRDDPGTERALAPQFANCATVLHREVLATPTYMSTQQDVGDLPWDEKTDDRLMWRGSPTGMLLESGKPWSQSQRVRLVQAANDAREEYVNVLPPNVSPGERVGDGQDILARRLNKAFMDMAFTGNFDGCDKESCDQLHSSFDFQPVQTQENARSYKYIMDVDGNGWSGRFRRLMSMNSLIFKSTIYPEWFTDKLEPWVHYVPIQVDYSDLYDALSFFGGDLSGGGAHDDMARKIATAGRDWTSRYWRQEDMTAYMFRLFLEYARVMNPDRTKMHYRQP